MLSAGIALSQTLFSAVYLHSPRTPRVSADFLLMRAWLAAHGETLVHHSNPLEFREQGRRCHPRASEASTFGLPFRRNHRSHGEARRSSPRTKTRYRAQVLPWLRAG